MLHAKQDELCCSRSRLSCSPRAPLVSPFPSTPPHSPPLCSSHSPCCHGHVICFSVYAGPGVDFGGGAGGAAPPPPGAPRRSMLWVDTWLDGDESRAEEAAAIVDAFRPFWESAAHKKVWHNYSFDRHVMERLRGSGGLRMAGFGGDTMHMARLWDSSRMGRGGYSLEALSSEPLPLLQPLLCRAARATVSVVVRELYSVPELI